MQLHGNYVGGQWIATGEGTPDINPSDTRDVVGLYAQADRALAAEAIGAARAAQPLWGASLWTTVKIAYVRLD